MSYSASAVAGSTLQIERSSPAEFQTIKGVEGFQGPTGSKGQIDVTAIDDVAKQFVADLPDYGTVTFTLFWDPDEGIHEELKTAFDTVNSTDNFKIVPSDDSGKEVTFTGEVIGFEWDFSRGQAQQVRVTIKLSGAASVA